MPRTYTISLHTGDVQITDIELSKFADGLDLPGGSRARVSELLLVDLFGHLISKDLDPSRVVDEINNLERGDGHTETKLATKFRNPPLAGLWHKHFFSEHFLSANISIALNNSLDGIIKNEFGDEGSLITKEKLDKAIHRILHEPIQSRASDNKLTGEWIVFAKESGKNYYLCVNTHKAGDEFIADRIREHCLRQFPFLSAILK